ncbi:mannosyl (alpha-1,3-)-glycoprotein beta-1,2-N-acetylglucosaminyltransferase L homeolog isoform X1 [Xenopus laevis]|uniref:Alpha-1,3-mannosyl-glycoprotein 2-beta-N-acetylglucosaminyltransferase n=2 Tax=Xenopus laevis TaxID=8355 RepID=Q2TAG3_XENLA|nr:mannosyl (alpha-1,3-)-glycoprotein beta-1,2-N-acetylglucosaminyltransferase L homeolog [Xenopus laevis]XP_018084075.1 mannosyl (alpha-1,3-)-glycoprotein beta-1,2-N-acetylglucosaminyltransferase L homeolog isoform X1 [Xenopus laevis]XP_018084076.1 mannosyl (alpha-1,3-)-glycoprotein beta-1,2-N-acetylglucosaminyltransferase L homeolog isoform X1 [Xenopus laevis]XP_018084077.1 mannosyl (alpha-1,3-)-glycoprotein beta-1,2-N-acetylglucosaminyltransferase L homeolog isoform X1 [Xenopus laevis]AAI109
MPRKVSVAAWGAALFISWNAILLLYLMSRSRGTDHSDLTAHVIQLAEEAEAELEKQKGLLQQIHYYSGLLNHQQPPSHVRPEPITPNMSFPSPSPVGSGPLPLVIPILVVACDRPSVRRCLDSLLKYRPSAENFPIIVSQDCGHEETSKIIDSYGDAVTHIKQPDLSEVAVPPEHRKFQGYYKISRHYRWALNQIFKTMGYKAAIVVEDDLEVAPDFYEYFQTTISLLQKDRMLWCVSAWNDNGKEALIDPGGSSLLYRSDFFPGLGWLLLQELWEELEPKWPSAFWDDWVRRPEQRLGRACVRPELSRTRTFGRKGVSQGQFFDQHLRFIKLNQDPVAFTKMDLSYLLKDTYDPWFRKQVYGAPKARAEEVLHGQVPGGRTVRVEYTTKDTFKAMARAFGVMEDLKSGVARAAYKGVVSFTHRGRRVFLAPPKDWAGYDPSWT